ncbi:hypothetical protein PIB30_004380 [Stylosanthes scabra]|uniref:Transmembrane protein 45A-like n=1 Tax=Stylosanthes scabra TaxID=79078 RepID=A0ABU6U5D7_9FABA|nr:hypothetical protein [Stylosanthes scabra]
MGTLVGHVAPGFGFLLIGLWHLFNNIKLHALNPKSYTSRPWFIPWSSNNKFKYIELILIMAGSMASVAMELFIGPERHQPLDPDGTIPSNHLHNFEHSSISLTFFVFASFSIIIDKLNTVSQPAKHGLSHLLAAIAFSQQLLLFHLHSADHMGPEGQYHLLLQLLIFVSLATTLMGIGLPRSFLVSFVRSISIFFQGLWMIVMGYMLWTPSLIPKGCFLNDEEGHQVVRCSSHEALHRANSLVNIEFSWFIILVTVFAVSVYLGLVKVYGEKVEYFSLGFDEEDQESNDDVESQKKSFVHVAKVFSSGAHDHMAR